MSPGSHGGVPNYTVQTATRGSQLIRAARPHLIEGDAADLRAIGVQLDATVAPLLAAATVPSWTGLAGDNYDVARANLRTVVQGCADAFDAAADAMETYAGVVRWAYGQAQDAIETYRARLTVANMDELLIEQSGVVAAANRAVREVDAELRVALNALSQFLPRPASPVSECMRDAGDWWQDLEGWQQLLVTAAFAAIVAASGGTVGVAFGTAGVATYGLEHAHGAATFTEDPGQATSDYLATATPASAAWDVGETALTFGPYAFGGALFGHGVRGAAIDLAANPSAYAAAMRTTLASDAGVMNPSAFLRREPIALGNGATLQPLDAQAQVAAQARYNDLPASHMHARGPEGAYQERLYGQSEHSVQLENILPSGRRQTVVLDGFSAPYGAVADAKFIASERSFYLPGSMESAKMEALALSKMDVRLNELAAAARISGGNGVVEITTNNTQMAHIIEARMRALNVTGYVRLEP